MSAFLKKYYLRIVPINISESIVIALFAGGYRDTEPILRRRQRARGIGRECARRVHQSIEIEPDFAGLADAMVGKLSVEKASGAVGRGFAGGVTQNKKKIGCLRIFEHGLEPENLSVDGEFGYARRGHVGGGTEDGWDVEHFGWVVWDPARLHAVGAFGAYQRNPWKPTRVGASRSLTRSANCSSR